MTSDQERTYLEREDEIREKVKEFALFMMREGGYAQWEIESVFRSSIVDAAEILQKSEWAALDAAAERVQKNV